MSANAGGPEASSEIVGVDPRRVVVVGPCAAGKSTLVQGLRERGYNARVVGQEHSVVAHLWQRSEPDILIALDVDIATVRERRDAGWPEWLFEIQHERLAAAVHAADLVIDTTTLDIAATLDTVVAFLEGERAR